MFNSLTFSIIVFIGAALVIVMAGTKLTRLADTLADQTGLGEALFGRSEEHTSELQSRETISYAVFCLKKKKKITHLKLKCIYNKLI